MLFRVVVILVFGTWHPLIRNMQIPQEKLMSLMLDTEWNYVKEAKQSEHHLKQQATLQLFRSLAADHHAVDPSPCQLWRVRAQANQGDHDSGAPGNSGVENLARPNAPLPKPLTCFTPLHFTHAAPNPNPKLLHQNHWVAARSTVLRTRFTQGFKPC